MSLRLEAIIVDCMDFRRLGHWWQEALGWDIVDEDADGIELLAPSGRGPSLLFLDVPERKTTKNRLHLDFVPDDQEAEVARLLARGASRVDVGQGERSWVVLGDPEGNEFCILSARE
ncbi:MULTISPECIES: VOC family protein [unclassified Rathayibacter]|uniref:VOC family protein n=1 Tax=unclassified Rathayibacter TaxID=2609250 RepID=UPI001889F54D|nr:MULTISPECIES: VOC family protein [unclassified Rathayibacter]MBF4461154.1 VOC family protein [Rathayibacter sp. VKM Ac-2879]MBF4502565.1 VOC family protein [Rathayibacter sp. VKM Ac-2878]